MVAPWSPCICRADYNASTAALKARRLWCACCVQCVLPHAAKGLAEGVRSPGAAGTIPPPLEVDPSPAAGPPFPPLPMLVTPPCPDSVTCCRVRLPAPTKSYTGR